MKKCRLALRVILVLVVAGWTGCGEAPDPRPDRVMEVPDRIVSLFPSWTEVLFVLEVGDRIVGRSRFCDHPAAALALPSLGGGFGVNMEALVELKPDLVLVYDEDLCNRIRRLGIRAVSVRAETLEEVYAAYETLARAVGLPGRGLALAERVRGEIEAQQRRFARMRMKRVLICVDGNSGHVVGPGNFVHELLMAVGGVNVAADASRAYPVYSLEAAVRKDPEVILDTTVLSGSGRNGSMKTFIRGLEVTTAGRKGRIRKVSHNLMTRSGPRLGEAAKVLGELIHREP